MSHIHSDAHPEAARQELMYHNTPTVAPCTPVLLKAAVTGSAPRRSPYSTSRSSCLQAARTYGAYAPGTHARGAALAPTKAVQLPAGTVCQHRTRTEAGEHEGPG